jgi:hypothetical protein
MGEYAAAMKKVENDPYIPMSEKVAKAKELLAKTRNVQEVELKFMQSPAYDRLPTEAEEAEKQSEERELENAQILEKLEKAVNDTDSEETMKETVNVEGNESEVFSDEANEKADDRFSNIAAKDLDMLQDIEEIYQRIQLNVQLEDGGDMNIRTEYESKVGGQINIIL